MSRKLHFNQMSENALEALSTWALAEQTLLDLSAAWKEAEEERQEEWDARRKADPEASVVDLLQEQTLQEDALKNSRKRLRADMAAVQARYVPETLYAAYLKATQGETAAFSREVRAVLEAFGASGTEDKVALGKAVRGIMTLAGGATRGRVDKETGERHFSAVKKSRTFEDGFMRVLMEYLAYDRRVIVIDPRTLKVTQRQAVSGVALDEQTA